MKTINTNQRAFGIVELLVGSAILSMVAAAVVAGAVTLQRSFLVSNEFGSAKVEQLRVLDALKRDARGATSAEVRGDGSTVVLTMPTGDASLLKVGLPATVRAALGGSSTPVTKTVSYTILNDRVLRTENNHSETIAVRLSRFYVAPTSGDLLATVAFKSRFKGEPEETPTTRLIASVKVRGGN